MIQSKLPFMPRFTCFNHLEQKTFLSTVLILSLILLSASVLLRHYQQQLLQQHAHQLLHNTTHLLHMPLLLSFQQNNPDMANHSLSALSKHPLIKQARVYDKNRQLWASYPSTSTLTDSQLSAMTLRNFWTLRYPFGDQQHQATLILYADHTVLQQEMNEYDHFLLTGLALLLLPGLLILGRLHHIFYAPLKKLTELLQQVIQDKNYALRCCVSPQLEPEQEIRDLSQGFNQLLGRLQQQEQSLQLEQCQFQKQDQNNGRLFAQMSHEIRTPMNAMLGMCELLLDSGVNTEQSHWVNSIQQSGKNLLSSLQNMLDFSYLKMGRLTLQVETLNVNHLLDELLQRYYAQACQKKVHIYTFLDHDLLENLLGDKQRLQQVLGHLLSNAIRFSRHDDIIIRVKQLKQEKDRVLLGFEVEDNGQGIPQDKLNHLFQAFAHSHDSTTQPEGCAGLGLAVSKQLVQLMGGKIGGRNHHQGAVFWFSAYLKIPQIPVQSHPENSLPSILATQIKVHRVLILSDQLNQCRVLSHYLDYFQVEHEITHHYQDTQAQLQKHKQYFDCLIVDGELQENDTQQLINLELLYQQLDTSKQARLIYLQAPSCQYLDINEMPFERRPGWLVLPQPLNRQNLLQSLSYRESQPSSAQIDDLQATSEIQITKQNKIRRISKKVTKTKTKAHVLLVEDNPINQDVTILLLQRLDYHVSLAINGQDALQQIAENGLHSYDIILMDCLMPEMDGFAATTHLRKQAYNSLEDPDHIPIIALTAQVLPGDKAHCLSVGMDDYLSKPVTKNALQKMLATWLDKKA